MQEGNDPTAERQKGEAAQLGRVLHNFVYNQCEGGWWSETAPEPVNAPYREVPWLNPREPHDSKLRWRVVVQRNPDNSAAVFYAGTIPGLESAFTNHPQGLKLFKGSPNRLQVGFIDEITVPEPNIPLSSVIYAWRQEKGLWQTCLMEYENLPYGDQRGASSCLQVGNEYNSPLITQIQTEFFYRQLELSPQRSERITKVMKR